MGSSCEARRPIEGACNAEILAPRQRWKETCRSYHSDTAFRSPHPGRSRSLPDLGGWWTLE